VREHEVRAALFRKVLCEHLQEPNTLVLEELGLRHGQSRIDIAVVNGFLHGYEIKSEADTLERLPRQIIIYSSVLDFVTLVVSEKHTKDAAKKIPTWWGIKILRLGSRGGARFECKRPAKMNPSLDPIAVAELLWRSEAASILESSGMKSTSLRAPRSALYRELALTMELGELRRKVRDALKNREAWRDRSQLS
jgi:hypothetical protein